MSSKTKKIIGILLILILFIAIFGNLKSIAAPTYTINATEEKSYQISNVNYADANWVLTDSTVATITNTGKSGIQIDNYINYTYSVTIKALKKGNTTLILRDSYGAIISRTNIEVTNNLISIEGFEESVVNITKGKEYQSVLMTTPVNPDDLGVVTWSSSNTDIATIDENGKVKAKEYGTTTIKAVVQGKEYTYTLNVVLPFTDVKTTDWFYGAVKYTYDNGILKGATDTEFRPSKNITRADLLTILWRMEGEPQVTGVKDFPDVSTEAYYANAVRWGTKNNIVSGYKNGKFGPTDNITREQLATILYNYAKYKGKNVTANPDLSKYKDWHKVTGYAQPAMKWAIAKGVVSGKDNSTRLDPQGTASRAEATAMIYNYCTRIK